MPGQPDQERAGGRNPRGTWPRTASTWRRGLSLGKGWKCGVVTELRRHISAGALQGGASVV